MGFLRQKLNTFLGNSPAQSGQASRVEIERSSMDSGYQSMLSKPENPGAKDASLSKLRKNPSAFFQAACQGAQVCSETLRAKTSYFYVDQNKPERANYPPSNERSECQTPKKQRERVKTWSSSVSKAFSSPRSRRRFNNSTEAPSTPAPTGKELAPTLNKDIPSSMIDDEAFQRVSGHTETTNEATKMPIGPKRLWPGPTRVEPSCVSPSHKQNGLQPVSLHSDNPYVESQREYIVEGSEHRTTSSSGPEILHSKTAGVSEDSPWRLRDSAAVQNARAAEIRCKPLNLSEESIEATEEYTAPSQHAIPGFKKTDGTTDQMEQVHSSPRRSIRRVTSLQNDRRVLLGSCSEADTTNPFSDPSAKDPSSDIYEANSESSGPSPRAPSMGSRAEWECSRADRDRRYRETICSDDDATSEYHSNVGSELTEQPSKKTAADELGSFDGKPSVADTCGRQYRSNWEAFKVLLDRPTGDLPYAVEAIKRLSGNDEALEALPDRPIGDLHYAVEAIERQWCDESGNTTDCSSLLLANNFAHMVEGEGKKPPVAVWDPPEMHLPSSPDNQSPCDAHEQYKHRERAICLDIDNSTAKASSDDENQELQDFLPLSTSVSANPTTLQYEVPSPEDPYEAAYRAAGFRSPSYPRRFSVAQNEQEGLISQTTDSTNGSHDAIMSSLPHNSYQPYPNLQLRSRFSHGSSATAVSSDCGIAEPAPLDPATQYENSENISPALSGNGASEYADKGESRRASHECSQGGALLESYREVNRHDYPSSPSPLSNDKGSPESKVSTPEQKFIAARLPNFRSPSPKSPGWHSNAPMNLRRAKTRPLAEATGNARAGVSQRKSSPKPKIKIQSFGLFDGRPHPYPGHELDYDSSVVGSSTKGFDFAKSIS